MTDFSRSRNATPVMQKLRLGRWRKVQAVFEEMRALQTEVNVIHCSAAISALSGQWPLALVFLELAVALASAQGDADSVSFNAMLGVYAKNSMWQAALAALDLCIKESVDVDVVGFSTAMRASEQASCWIVALEILDEMFASMTRPNAVTYSTLVSACGKAGKWAAAFACLDHMERRSSEPTLITLNAGVTSCDRGLQWQVALDFRSWLGSHSAKPDDVTCRASMSACQKVGRWSHTLSLHQRGAEEGFKLGEIGCRSAIDACSACVWRLALGLFAGSLSARLHGLDTAGASDQDHLGTSMALSALISGDLPWQAVVDLLQSLCCRAVRLNDVCVNSGVSTYAAHRWDLALQVVRELKFNSFNWNAAIAACQRASQWQRGCRMLLVPGIDVVGFNAALPDLEKWRHALWIFGELSLRSLRKTAISFNSLVATCGTARQWALALLALSLRENMELTAVSCNAALSACEKSSFWEHSLLLLSSSQAWLSPDVFSFSGAISACEKASTWQTALRLLAGSAHSRVRSNVICSNAATSACEGAGQWRSALLSFCGLRHQALEPDLLSHSAAMSAVEKAGKWQLPTLILREMPCRGLQADVICCQVAITACETAEVSRSRQLYS
eukprot:s4181_g4.t1